MTTDPRCLVCQRPMDACRTCHVGYTRPPRWNCDDCDICDERCVAAAGLSPARLADHDSTSTAERSPDDDTVDVACCTSSVDVTLS
jgi:hypothetical protein